MLISREQVAPCALPEDVVSVPVIGGDVLVRGMDMPQLMRFRSQARAASKAKKGESADEASERAGGEMLPVLLEMTVLAGDGEPVYSAAQWRAFAVKHIDQALQLSAVSMRLAGLEKDPGKP